MQIFIIEGNVVKPTTEILLISPFKQIWESDDSPHKEKAIMDFTFIEFMCSPKKTNVFFGYTEDERASKIISQVFKGTPDYVPSELVVEGMKVYLDFLTNASITYKTLRANKIAAEKTNDFFSTFQYSDKNPRTGNPLYKPKEVTMAIKDAAEVMKSLNGLQDKVDQELFESAKTKGSRDINEYER